MSGWIMFCKVVFLFFAIMFTSNNMARTYARVNIPVGNFIWQAFSITGFVFLQWLI